jgi:ABC-type multidrug transport system permease subunit
MPYALHLTFLAIVCVHLELMMQIYDTYIWEEHGLHTFVKDKSEIWRFYSMLWVFAMYGTYQGAFCISAMAYWGTSCSDSDGAKANKLLHWLLAVLIFCGGVAFFLGSLLIYKSQIRVDALSEIFSCLGELEEMNQNVWIEQTRKM